MRILPRFDHPNPRPATPLTRCALRFNRLPDSFISFAFMNGSRTEPQTTGIRAVIFDMDGVLTDSEPLINAAAVAMFREKGLTVQPDDFVRGIRMNEFRVESATHDRVVAAGSRQGQPALRPVGLEAGRNPKIDRQAVGRREEPRFFYERSAGASDGQ